MFVAKLNDPKVVSFQMPGDENTSNTSIYNTQAMVHKTLVAIKASEPEVNTKVGETIKLVEETNIKNL